MYEDTPFFNIETLVGGKPHNMGLKILEIISETFPDILECLQLDGSRFRRIVFRVFLLIIERSHHQTNKLCLITETSTCSTDLQTTNNQTVKIDV
jgi:hypothetical protein